MATELLTTPEKYRKWLIELPDNTYVGVAMPERFEFCPLATFITDTLGTDWYVDECDCWKPRVGSEPLPDWAIIYIQEVDYKGSRKIYKEEALKLLDG